MKKRINFAQELLELCRQNVYLEVVGKNWIGSLVACYLKKYMNWEGSCINFEAVNNNFDSTTVFVIAQQEAQGVQEADKFVQTMCATDCFLGDVYYISNEVKDEIDRILQDDPELYEEILILRKQQLDAVMHSKFVKDITMLMEEKTFPCFQSIEIETINRCNGTCSFCPVNRQDDSRAFAKMETAMFESIISQLAAMGYQGRVSLCSNNEPFLDKRIMSFAKMTKDYLPNACKVIFTNGTLLHMDNFLLLVEFLDVFCIDVYHDSDIRAALNEDMRKIFQYCLLEENKRLRNKVMVNFINRNAIRNNRGGQSKNRHNFYSVKATCLLPYIQMIVRPDGKLSLCCNDALGRNTLGDLSHESLIEAWNNKNYQRVRQQILEGRQNFAFCSACDNFASLNTKGNEMFSKAQIDSAWRLVKKILSHT